MSVRCFHRMLFVAAMFARRYIRRRRFRLPLLLSPWVQRPYLWYHTRRYAIHFSLPANEVSGSKVFSRACLFYHRGRGNCKSLPHFRAPVLDLSIQELSPTLPCNGPWRSPPSVADFGPGPQTCLRFLNLDLTVQGPPNMLKLVHYEEQTGRADGWHSTEIHSCLISKRVYLIITRNSVNFVLRMFQRSTIDVTYFRCV